MKSFKERITDRLIAKHKAQSAEAILSQTFTSVGAAASGLINAGDRKQSFIDNRFIESSKGITLTPKRVKFNLTAYQT